jgi:hypothetical protein
MTDIHIGYEHSMPKHREVEYDVEGDRNRWIETIFRLDMINPFYQAVYKNNWENAIECLKEGAHPLIGDASYASEMIGDRIFFDRYLVDIILHFSTNKKGLQEYIDLGIQVYQCALNRFEDRDCIPIYRYQSDETFKFNLIGLFTKEEIMNLCRLFISHSVANLVKSFGYAISLD